MRKMMLAALCAVLCSCASIPPPGDGKTPCPYTTFVCPPATQ